MSLILALVTFLLVVISLFMVLVILMQRAKSDGGVGAALGGGMAESAFGGETANVLTKATQVGAVLFFVLAFGLYLGRIHQHRAALTNPDSGLPSVEMPTLPPVEGALPSATPGELPPVAETPTAPVEGPAPVESAPAAEAPPAADTTPASAPETSP
jgi:preprotein translocase subunit SecG